MHKTKNTNDAPKTQIRTPLQIVPYQKNNFDLFSLITFLDCTVSSYISTKVFKARKKKAGHSIDYQIYGYHIKDASVLNEQNYSILIEFSKDYEFFYDIQKKKRIDEDDCLEFQPFFT